MARRRRRHDEEDPSYWLSYSDMMAGLILMFVIIISFTLLESKRQFEIDEKALREQQLMLTQQQTTLDEQKATMSEQQTTLEDQQKQLTDQQKALAAEKETTKTQQTTLDEQQKTMEAQQLALEAQQKLLDEQKAAVEAAQSTVEAQQTELDAKQKTVDDQQQKLKDAEKQLKTQQKTLDEQTSTLETQQAQIESQQKQMEDLIGVRAELVEELRTAFEGKANVSVDPKTGAIMFDANILFEQTEYQLLDDGKVFLKEYLPDYFSILLSDEFLDYVSEVIIEGHCDTDGGYIYNMELSQQRALAVAEYCLNQSQDSENDASGEPVLDEDTADKLSSIMSVNGRSFSDPVYNEDGTENKEASRRVEVKFRLKDEEMVQGMMNILNG